MRKKWQIRIKNPWPEDVALVYPSVLIGARGSGFPRRHRSGGVAQMGERYVRNVQVRGSIPLISTIALKGKDVLSEKKC